MSKQQPATLLCHDALSRLARDNPKSFEILRLELIENCVADAPEPIQLRLRQLQFRIDGIRRRSGSPLGAIVKIQALMWESFLDMNDELQGFVTLTRRPRSCAIVDADSTRSEYLAPVLPFRAGPPKAPAPG